MENIVHALKNMFFLIIIICLVGDLSNAQPNVSNKRPLSLPFNSVLVKKNINGKICDNCPVDFALNAELDFSYILTGVEHASGRLSKNQFPTRYGTDNNYTNIHVISNAKVGITFLPNYLIKDGKYFQLLRNFKGIPYKQLEFEIRQNNSVIRNWERIRTLKEIQDYTIFGIGSDDPSTIAPWEQTFHAGSFELKVDDLLSITVRTIETKEIIRKIAIFRPVDKASDFIYYQIPLTNDDLGHSLQNILNLNIDTFKAFKGDSSTTFIKEYNSLGILRFTNLQENEVLEYSFGNNPLEWKSIKTRDPRTGIFLVLPSTMKDGKRQRIFLRYQSQPETIHSIEVQVNKRPFKFPWFQLSFISIIILAIIVIGFNIRERRNKKKLAALTKKNIETETYLALLSGQLNPHFLFNTLNAIQGTIGSNNPDISNAYIGSVAKFMRDVMDSGRKEFISLKEELKMEEDYLQLEQQRLAFQYTITISPDLDPDLIDIPPLLLQPILENSIRHGFGSNHHASMIKITVNRLDNALVIRAIDNGDSVWYSSEVSEGHGLSLTRKRLSIYNEKLQNMLIFLDVSYVEMEMGTVATFTLNNWLL
ncbi:MAG: histidine kinase [Pedobacter sp.]